MLTTFSGTVGGQLRQVLLYLARKAHAPVAPLYIFSTVPHKWQDFRENVTEHKMCVLIFSTTFV
jgi:hypothetical protein